MSNSNPPIGNPTGADDIQRVKKRKPILPLPCIIIAAACVLAFAACLLVSSLYPRTLYDQRMWQFYATGSVAPVDDAVTPDATTADTSSVSFSQVSAFLARGSGYDYIGFLQLRQRIADKYTADGLLPPGDSSQPWLDAASGTVQGMSVKGESRTANGITVTAILGDFFYFHPTVMKTGTAIVPHGISKDVIMLDTQTAWDAFGSYDIVGARAELNGVPCIVGGVFEKDKNDTAKSRIYVSYEFLVEINASAELNTLEFVLPGPVSGYGTMMMYNEADSTGLLASIPQQNIVIVDNSTRFEPSTLLKTIGNLGDFVAQTREIALPYWENAARAATLTAAIFLVLALVFATFPIIVILIALLKAARAFSAVSRRRKAAREFSEDLDEDEFELDPIRLALRALRILLRQRG